MRPTTAKRVIVASTVIVLASSTIDAVRQGRAPAPRVILGGLFVAGSLSLIAGAVPGFAAALAAIFVVGALLASDTIPRTIIARVGAEG